MNSEHEEKIVRIHTDSTLGFSNCYHPSGWKKKTQYSNIKKTLRATEIFCSNTVCVFGLDKHALCPGLGPMLQLMRPTIPWISTAEF